MPMGISTQDLLGMSIPALEELRNIATQMVQLTTLGEQYKLEYGQLAAEVSAEIKRKQMELKAKQQLEERKIEQAKQKLKEEQVEIQANLELFGDQEPDPLRRPDRSLRNHRFEKPILDQTAA